MIQAKINDIETKKHNRKILIKLKASFWKDKKQTDKTLADSSSKKRVQMNKIRNKREVTNDSTEI